MGELTRHLKDQFKETVTSSNWLDDAVKDVAVTKLEKMDVGFPGPETRNPVNVFDPSALKAYYRAINITTTHLDNIWAIRVWFNNRIWSLLGRTDLEPEWPGTPHTVNAYASLTANNILFPAAFLQPPQFHPNYPSTVNFAAMGGIVGHEITHGFDTLGRLYSPEGEYKNWWTNATEKEFTRRAECFVGQYGNFTFEGPDGTRVATDGMMTLDENIADSGGLNTAFEAWERHRKSHPDRDLVLPGLERWTTEQQFFLAFAYTRCGKWSRDGAAWFNEVAVWALPNFRVTGPLQNSRRFREVFGCKAKGPTCEMW